MYCDQIFCCPLSYQGKKIKCSTSQAKHRLFIGNVPRNWDDEDLKKAVTGIGPGVIYVELLKVNDFVRFIIVHVSFSHFKLYLFVVIIIYYNIKSKLWLAKCH